MNIAEILNDLNIDEQFVSPVVRSARQAGRQAARAGRRDATTLSKQIKNIDARLARMPEGRKRAGLLAKRNALQQAMQQPAQPQAQQPAQPGQQPAQPQAQQPVQPQVQQPVQPGQPQAQQPVQPGQPQAQQPVQPQAPMKAPLPPMLAQKLDMGITNIKNRAAQGDQRAIMFLKRMAAQVAGASTT